MKKKLPLPLQRQLIKMMLTALAISIVGLATGLTSDDHVTLWLTCTLLIAYVLRIVVMFKEMVGEQYDIVEGTILSVTDVRLQRQQTIVLMNSEQRRLRLSGRRHFTVGEHYRLYLRKMSQQQIQSLIPMPYVLLGYEQIQNLS